MNRVPKDFKSEEEKLNYEQNNTTTKGLRRKNLKKDFETLLRKIETSLFLINSLGHCRLLGCSQISHNISHVGVIALVAAPNSIQFHLGSVLGRLLMPPTVAGYCPYCPCCPSWQPPLAAGGRCSRNPPSTSEVREKWETFEEVGYLVFHRYSGSWQFQR